MSDAVRFLGGIDAAIKRSKVVAIVSAAAAVVAIAVTVFLSLRYTERMTSMVYVLDNGSVLEARREQNDSQLDLEIKDHVRRYHELMYNISPDSGIIESNYQKAQKLGKTPAVMEYDRRREQRFYEQLVAAGAFQTIKVSSVEVDMSREPYRVVTDGEIKFWRGTTLTRYSIHTVCYVNVLNDARDEDNLHGLMISSFEEIQQKEIEQSIVSRNNPYEGKF